MALASAPNDLVASGQVQDSEQQAVQVIHLMAVVGEAALDRRHPYYDPISTLGEASQKWWPDQT